MSYEALLRKAWKSGDFSVTDAERGRPARTAAAGARLRREMEEIAAREAGTPTAASSPTGRES